MPTCPICNRPLMAGEALIFDGSVLWHEVNVGERTYTTEGRRTHTSQGWCGRNIRVAPLPGVDITDCPCGMSRDASIHTQTEAQCNAFMEEANGPGSKCSNPGEHHQYGRPGTPVATW